MQCLQRQPKRSGSEESLHNKRIKKTTHVNVKLLGTVYQTWDVNKTLQLGYRCLVDLMSVEH